MSNKLRLIQGWALFFIIQILFGSLYAWECLGPEPGEPEKYIGSTGTIKVLVIVIADKNDTLWPGWDLPNWMQGNATYPYICPSSDPADIQSDPYKWSLSNFLYSESQGQLIFYGDINPGKNDKFFVLRNDLNLTNYPSRAIMMAEIQTQVLEDLGQTWAAYTAGYNYYIWWYPCCPHPAHWLTCKSMHGTAPCPGNIAHFGSTVKPGNTELDFNLGTSVGGVSHEFGHSCGLWDKYDGRINGNPFTQCEVTGLYSNMERTADWFNHVTHACPFSPRDKMPGSVGPYPTFGWITPTPITTNDTYTLQDFSTTGDIYKIPIKNYENTNEYFLIVNHQPSLNNWEDEYEGEGILIWHIREDFTMWSSSPISETKKCEDVECAIGMYDTTGANPGVATPCPELGWDPIDHFLDCLAGPLETWWNNLRNGKSRDASDFFPYTPSGGPTNNSFTPFSNPNSNGYNLTDYPTFQFHYGAGSGGGGSWSDAYEDAVPQNIATHIAIENIREDPVGSGIMKMNIKLDYVQSDAEIATGSNNARSIAYDGSKLCMTYNSKGHSYYTYRYNDVNRGTECWMSAIPYDRVDYTQSPYISTNSKYPALALDNTGGKNICWVGKVGDVSKLYYSRSGNVPQILHSETDAGWTTVNFGPPAIIVDNSNNVIVVMMVERRTSYPEPGQAEYEIKYWKGSAGSALSLQSPDIYSYSIPIGTSLLPVSIDIDNNNYLHIAFEKYAQSLSTDVYYTNNSSGSWSTPFCVAENAITPFIDLYGTAINKKIAVVYEKDNDIWWRVYESGNWNSSSQNISNTPSVPSHSPQLFAGKAVVWSEQRSGQYDICSKHWIDAQGGWSQEEWLSNTTSDSKYPQSALRIKDPRVYPVCYVLECVWTERDAPNYEVKYNKTEFYTQGNDHNGANLTIASNTTLSGLHWNIGTFTVNPGCTLGISPYDGSDTGGVLTIDANTISISGILSATGKGYPSASGPYKGSQGSNGAGAGGGSGMGQAGSGETGIAGGNAYPDTLSPLAYIGCGGGNGSSYSAPGGYGGGIIHLSANLINISGVIESNGTNGEPAGSDYAGAGGGAGSCWISCDSLSGNGVVKVVGGNGAYRSTAQAGGGSGGYLEIDYKNSSFHGHLIANGGSGAGSIYPDRAQDGQPGIIKVKQSDGNVEMLVSPVNTTTGSHNKESSIVGALFNISSVMLDSGDSITGNTSITTSNEIYIAEGAVINADKKGFSGGNGTGKGTNGDNGYGSGGAGYGNVGGNGESGRQGGCAYGAEDSLCPTALGSGAGKGSNYYNVAPGGAGGGSLKLSANTITINGLVSASGEAGSTYASGYASGAGSGGSVYIICDSLKGSGTIQAKGNDGANNTDADGGGSAGGRIALIRNIETFSGNVSASGGIGPDLATDGGEGKVCRAERGEGGGAQGRSSRQLVYKLYQNYPNPFSKRTTLMYEIPTISEVSLKLYDLSGRCVRVLVGKENKLPGVYKTDLSSEDYPAGIYFAKFSAGKYRETKKLVLMR